MFKRASNLQSYLDRTASHATKESATGRIDAIPAWAKEPEEYYQSLRKQWDTLNERLISVTHRIQVLKERLKQTLPRKEYERLQAERDRSGVVYQATERALGEMRPLVRAAAMNAWGIVFFLCAMRMLDRETRQKLEDAAAEIMGRTPSDGIDKGRSDWSSERRHKDNRKEKLRIRRATLRMRRADEGKVEVRWEKRDGFWRRVFSDKVGQE